jgi:Porin PorA
MRKTAISCAVTGTTLLVAAALLAFWLTPQYIARLPTGSNTVRTYDGQIWSLLNPVALQRADFAAAVRLGLPETLHRQVQVLQTSGNIALVRDARTRAASGQQIGAVTSQFAVDRRSLEATANHPSSWSVTNAKGLTISWPIGAEQQTYTGWVDFTQTTTQLKYVRQEQHGGVNTYVYEASVPPTPIRNRQVLQGLPQSLPVSVLQRAGQAGLVSPSLLARLALAFPHAAQLPLGYTYQATSTYWVAPATGIIVDINASERQTGGVAVPGAKIIPGFPVLADTYKGSQASVQAAATDAKNGSNAIQTLGTTVPILVAAIGFALVVIAVILSMRGRKLGEPRVVEPPPADVRA